MMEIIVNGLKADITLDTEKTLGDVLRNFELECSRNNATTVDITIDGETIRADQFDSVTARDIDHIHTLELTTVSEKDILDAFKQLSTVFETVISELPHISVQFQNGQDKLAVESIKNLADSIAHFCHIATLAMLFPGRFGDIHIANMTVPDFFNELSPLLTEFENALKNNDTVMIGDIAEYEICPRLESLVKTIHNITI